MEKVTLLTDESPFTLVSPTVSVAGHTPAGAPGIGGSDDWYGACSIETFAGGVGSLTYTHEDAEGFLDYPTRFRNANFWYKDGNVRPWLYGEDFDNWQDTYGADAVTAFYHSGHGGMDANGVFSIPLGGVWGGSSWANSGQMFLGNEEARYVFFSTCFSCRVLGGITPVTTWWDHCLGFRMLFGFETVSVDSPDYGKFFWQEWNAGKSFSQAWLDASWRISHNQAPSVVAVGANQAEALNRLNTERGFNRAAAAKGWMQWRWYNAATALATARATRPAIPDQLSRIEFLPVANRMADVQRMAGELGFAKRGFDDAAIDSAGNILASSGEKGAYQQRVVVRSDGGREYYLKAANLENRQAISLDSARKVAEDTMRGLNITNMRADSVRTGYTAGGTLAGSGQEDKGHATDITIIYRPVVGGFSNVNHDHGNLMITVDNDGAVTTIRDTTRPVAEIRDVAPAGGPKMRQSGDVTKLLQDGIKGRYGRAKATLLKDTVRVGYDFSGKTGSLVVQGLFDVDFGHNMHKEALVRVPVL